MVRGITDKDKKEQAIALRKQGLSIRDIELELGVNRSTLSGWLKNVELSDKQRETLYKNWLNALVKARGMASDVHRNRRIKRVEIIANEAKKFVQSSNLNNDFKELLFAVFYLAEGTKKENSVCIANSNPEMLKAIVKLFRKIYDPDESKFRCCLHLRGDQSDEELKKFWSNQLDIPVSQFIKTQFDKRTHTKTYDYYKGVCVVHYYDMDLQRRILYIGNNLVEKWLYES